MIVTALLLTPIAWLVWLDDNKIDKRDKDLPAFLRGLGSVMGAVGTTVAEGLSRLNRRSLGAMEPHVRKLYVRLTNDLSPDMTWARLAGESGSELITRCVRIFSDGIKVGGDPAAVGDLASAFGQKVSLLRASRSMVSNSFAFVVVPMHAALLGIILFVTEVVLIFGNKISEVQDQNLDSDLIAEAGVSNAIVFAAPDAGFIHLLVVVSILMLTFANSFAPYAAGGGHREAALGIANADMQRGRGAHGMSDDMRLVDAERVHQRDHVVAETVLAVAVGIFRNIRRQIAALAEGDAAMGAREMPHLRLPRTVVAGIFVHEDDRRTLAGLLMIQPHAIRCGDARHRFRAFDTRLGIVCIQTILPSRVNPASVPARRAPATE